MTVQAFGWVTCFGFSISSSRGALGPGPPGGVLHLPLWAGISCVSQTEIKWTNHFIFLNFVPFLLAVNVTDTPHLLETWQASWTRRCRIQSPALFVWLSYINPPPGVPVSPHLPSCLAAYSPPLSFLWPPQKPHNRP